MNNIKICEFFIKIFVLIIIVFNPILLSQDIWKYTGSPEKGVIQNVLSVTDSILLVGSENGYLYRSTDFGNQWSVVRNGQGDGVWGMVSTSDNKIFVSCDWRLMSSNDFGKTWNDIFGISGYLDLSNEEDTLFILPYHEANYISTYNVQSNQLNTIYLPFSGILHQFCQSKTHNKWILGSSEGIHISTDNGITWQPFNVGLNSIDVVSLYLNDENELYAGTNDGVYYSSNFGLDWNYKNSGIPSNTEILNFLRTDDSVLIVGTSNNCFKTSDSGLNWTELSPNLDNRRIPSLANFDNNKLLIGSDSGVFVSEDSTIKYSSKGIAEITVNEFNEIGSKILAGSKSGLYYSFDKGENWFLNENSPTTDIHSIEVDSPYVYFIRNYFANGFWRSENDGDTWTFVQREGCCTDLISFSNHILSAGFYKTDFYLPPPYRGVWYSTDFGDNWNIGSLQYLYVVQSMGIDIEGKLFLGVVDQGSPNEDNLFISNDYGASALLSDNGLPYTSVNCIEFDSENNVYLGTDVGLYLSTNSGSMWQLLNFENNKISSIQIDNYNGIYLVSSDSVYRSTDNGLTFNNFNSGLENRTLNNLYISRDSYLFVGTDLGVFKSSEPITTDVGESKIILNDNYSLYQNFPNPFNPTTIIKFNIPNDALILLKIYDVLGSEISTLVDGYQTSGNHSIRFDASHLSSGVYFYILKAGNFIQSKKMILLK